jgi:AcrR family transcriptional regulator
MPEHYDIQEYLEDHVKDYPDKELKIINAAINSFSEKGFKSTTTSEIASRAGVAEGTIFRYFPTKDAILEKMVPLLMKIMVPKFEKPIKNIIKQTEGLGADVTFKTILFDRMMLIKGNQKFLLSVLPELIYRPALFEKFRQTVFPMIRMYIGNVVEAAKQRGEIKAGADADLMMYQLLGFVFSYSIIHGLEDEDKVKRDIDTFVDSSMKGWQV